jgi:hypothetical protein
MVRCRHVLQKLSAYFLVRPLVSLACLFFRKAVGTAISVESLLFSPKPYILNPRSKRRDGNGAINCPFAIIA